MISFNSHKIVSQAVAQVIFGLLLISGCGTYAGNPKKPTPVPDEGANKREEVIELPEINFEPPESLTEEEGGLGLVESEFPTGSRAVLKRVKIAVRQFNLIVKRLNKKIVHLNKAFNDDESSAKVRGRAVRIEASNELRFTLCRNGKPAMQLTWAQDLSKISLIRDHGQTVGDSADQVTEFVSALELDRSSGKTRLTFDHAGIPLEAADNDQNAKFLNEHTVWEEEGPQVQVATIADWYLENGMGQGKIDANFYAQVAVGNSSSWEGIGSRRGKCGVKPAEVELKWPNDWCFASKRDGSGPAQALEDSKVQALRSAYEKLGLLSGENLKSPEFSANSCGDL